MKREDCAPTIASSWLGPSAQILGPDYPAAYSRLCCHAVVSVTVVSILNMRIYAVRLDISLLRKVILVG